MDTTMTDDAQTVERRLRQAELKERLADILARDGDTAVVDLLNLALALWAERYPANLSDADKEKVSQNFEGATPSLIAERALSEEGVMMAMVALVQTATIAIDYRPESNCKDVVDADVAQNTAAKAFVPALQGAYQQATAAGLSPYGASSMMILFGAVLGLKKGLNWQLLARPLLETLGKTMEMGGVGSPISEAEAEERALQALMANMGISRTTARQYVARAKAAGDLEH